MSKESQPKIEGFPAQSILSWHRDERYLLKLEAQDQGVPYQPEVAAINRMGFFFNIQVPPVDVLCAMKLSAILARQKGRDFYDIIFLLSKTEPNMEFLQALSGITSMDELKNVDLHQKKRFLTPTLQRIQRRQDTGV